jgi:hypothetical protein
MKKKYINDDNESSLEEISNLRFKMGPHNYSEKKRIN